MKEKTKKKGNQTYTGTISINARGNGTLRTKQTDKQIEVPNKHLNTALPGDTVEVTISKKTSTGWSAKVVNVVRRFRYGFSGVLKQDEQGLFMEPSDHKMYTNIRLPDMKSNEADLGDKIFVILNQWNNAKQEPTAILKRVLGKEGEHETEMQAIALERGFQHDFPPHVNKEAEEIKKRGLEQSEYANRRDMRDVATFTIDPEDAKDFDDALSLTFLDNGNLEIGIHIADVSHYVQPKTALDDEAYNRSTSVYLIDRTIPMLPEELSNDLCSLNPNTDRFAFSVVLEMDRDGIVKKRWFGKTVIHSDRRFAYEEAQEVLNNQEGDFYDELYTMNAIAKKLNKRRRKHGSLILEQDEVSFVLDKNKKPIRPYRKTRFNTNKMIEEFMLLANVEVAKFCEGENDKKRFMLYRVHDAPSGEKLEDLSSFMRSLDIPFFIKDEKALSKHINRVLEDMEDSPLRDTVSIAVVRSMQKAVYSTENIGHFGLAFPTYTHFTSPIRRYPDLIVHRLLSEYLAKQNPDKKEKAFIENAADYTSSREREATDAERASLKFKQVEYMSDRIGQVFDGIVTGATEWGLYVEEKESKAEGMIKLRDLGDDHFSYNPKTQRLVGEKTKQEFKLGDMVQVVVDSVSIDRRQIDFKLHNEEKLAN